MNRDELKTWLSKNLFNRNGRIDSNKTKFTYFQKKRLENYYQQTLHHTSFLKEDTPFSQRIYYIINDITNIIGCKECGRNVRFINFKKGYHEFCSAKCAGVSKETKNKRMKTSLQKYGVSHPSKNTEVKEEICNGNLKSTGHKYPLQSEKSKQKLIKTNNEKWGSDFIGGSEEIKSQIKQTNQENLGVDYPFQSERVQKKQKETLKENYSVTSPAKIKEVKEKQINTMIDRYGVTNSFESLHIKTKIKNTLIEKYGVDNPFKSEEIKSQIKQTNKKKYGVEHISQRNITNITDMNKEFIEETFLDENNNIKTGDFQRYFNCCFSNIYKIFERLNIKFTHNKRTSEAEREIQNYILDISPEIKMINNTNDYISPHELDLFLPEYNIAIEHNGLLYHTEQHGKDKNYHLRKTQKCDEYDIKLFHINEDEWVDVFKRDVWKSIISAHLMQNNKIYARNCEMDGVNLHEKIKFLENNHLQGNINSKINIGLYHKKELISIMCFGKSRFNNEFQWELQRYCNKKFNTIVGGFSKLIKFFIANYGSSIITYADKRYSNGRVYETNGFKRIKENPPSYKYTNGHIVLSRMKAQKKNLGKLLDSYDENLTEYQNMYLNGWDKIWDCGNLVYVYEK